MRIAIIDGQGAGIGKTLIKKMVKEFKQKIYIYALGTNKIAAENMLNAGANECIWGDEAICSYLENENLDAIIGPIGILFNGGINGEITQNISDIVFRLDCIKYIIPLQKHGIYIPGTIDLKIKDFINYIIEDIKNRSGLT